MDAPASMSQQRLFSILFTSFWLTVYYLGTLAKGRRDRGALPLLLQAFWHGPRVLPVGAVSPVAGHCFGLNLDRDCLSDEHGISTLVLAEDGVLLPLPHTRDVREIAELGCGRYVHLERKILFSPIDNADATAVTARKYEVFETMTDDPAVRTELSNLGDRRNLYTNLALLGLEKLAVQSGGALSVGALADLGGSDLRLRNVDLDLSRWHLGTWHVANADIRTSSASDCRTLTVDFRGLSSRFSTAEAKGMLKLDLASAGKVALRQLRLDIDGRNRIDAECTWSESGLQSAVLCLSQLDEFRKELVRSVGGDEFAFVTWLDKFLSTWSAGAIGFPCSLPQDEARKIAAAMAPGADRDSLRGKIWRDGSGLRFQVVSEAESIGGP